MWQNVFCGSELLQKRVTSSRMSFWLTGSKQKTEKMTSGYIRQGDSAQMDCYSYIYQRLYGNLIMFMVSTLFEYHLSTEKNCASATWYNIRLRLLPSTYNVMMSNWRWGMEICSSAFIELLEGIADIIDKKFYRMSWYLSNICTGVVKLKGLFILYFPENRMGAALIGFTQ